MPNLAAIFARLRWKITLRFVVLSRFGERDVGAGFDGLVEAWQRDVLDGGAEGLQTFSGGFDRGLYFSIDALKKILLGPADLEFAGAALPKLPIIRTDGASSTIVRNLLEHDADVHHRAGHWTCVIERSRERDNTF